MQWPIYGNVPFMTPFPAFGGGGAPYVGPGDIVSGALGWWGLRGYNAAYSGNCCDVYSAGDAAHTVMQISNGNLVLAPVGGSLPNDSTNICTVKTLYDQSGNGLDLTQATEANRPTLNFSSLGSLASLHFTAASSQQLNSVSSIAQAEAFSISTVVHPTAGGTAGFNGIFKSNSDNIGLFVDNTRKFSMVMNGGATLLNSAVSTFAFHAFQGLYFGSSSKNVLDGTTTTGGAGTTALSGTLTIGLSSGVFIDGEINEFAIWGSDISASFAALNSNQHTYWGF